MAASPTKFDPIEKVHGDPLEMPQLACGAMAGSKPFVAAPGHQQALGFPGELVENWQEKAVVRLGELVDNSRALRVYLDSCVKCGACTDKCHYFLGTGDPKNMPVARQDLLRKVYEDPEREGSAVPNDPELPLPLDKVYPINEVVRVDYFLPGCPPSGDAIWKYLTDLILGRMPRLDPQTIHYD